MRAVVVALIVCAVLACAAGYGEQRASVRARELLSQRGVVDGHNDLPWESRIQWDDVVYGRGAPDLYGHVPGVDTTIPLLREGNVTGQFWSVYVSCEHQNRDAVRVTMEQIDQVKKMVNRYDDTFKLCTSAQELEEATENGFIASMMGMEGGHQIDSSL